MELVLDAVTVTYPGGRPGLRSLSARFTRGLWAVLGPNGAGKTTLMRTAATLLRPGRGRVAWAGIDAARHPQRVRRHLGYAPQEPHFPADMAAAAYLEYLAALKGVRGPVRRRRVHDMLELVGLGPFAHRRPDTYSAGMKGRLALAQALLSDPDLLLLDEPAAWLDPAERIAAGNLLADLARDRVVLVSTHTPDDLEGMADGVLLVDQGAARYMGPAADLRARAAGRVWAGAVPAAGAARLPGRLPGSLLLARRRTAGGEWIRLLAPPGSPAGEPPFPGAAPVPPTLEDAYFLTMQNPGMEVPQWKSPSPN